MQTVEIRNLQCKYIANGMNHLASSLTTQATSQAELLPNHRAREPSPLLKFTLSLPVSIRRPRDNENMSISHAALLRRLRPVLALPALPSAPAERDPHLLLPAVAAAADCETCLAERAPSCAM